MPARKAKAAANAAAAKPALILTKPTKGAAAKKAQDRLSITGHETLAKKMRERGKKLDSLGAEQKKDITTIRESVKVQRLAAEKAGDFHKTVLVESADGKPVQVIFQDRFSKVDIEHEAALRDALSGNYDQLFGKGVDVKLKANASLEALKAALGDKFDAFAALCDITEYLAPTKDYMTKRSAIRGGLDETTNDAIDAITDQVQVSPSVKLK